MIFKHSKLFLEANAMTLATNSPQIRLAASRKALIRQMARTDGHPEDNSLDSMHESNQALGDVDTDSPHISTWQVLTQAAAAWWQHHPAQMAIDIGRPFLNSYARNTPFQLLGIAAVVGAASVLVKPWRLISVTGLAVAAFKSTRLPATMLSLLQRTSTIRTARKTEQSTKSMP